jgi:hypothetical protein
MRVTGEWQVGKIFESLFGSLRPDFAQPGEASQHLGYLDIDQVWCMQ